MFWWEIWEKLVFPVRWACGDPLHIQNCVLFRAHNTSYSCWWDDLYSYLFYPPTTVWCEHWQEFAILCFASYSAMLELLSVFTVRFKNCTARVVKWLIRERALLPSLTLTLGGGLTCCPLISLSTLAYGNRLTHTHTTVNVMIFFNLDCWHSLCLDCWETDTKDFTGGHVLARVCTKREVRACHSLLEL